MEIDEKQRAAFAEAGVVSLRRVIAKGKTTSARDYLLEELKRLRLREGGKWQTKKFDGVSPFQVAGKIAHGIRHHPVFDDVIPYELVSLLNSFAGCELRPAQVHPQILLTPPQKETWALPETGWHVDVAVPVKDVVPGIQVFVLIDDVAPRGGGTMAIAGSHRSRDVAPTPDHVLEMCGNAGDVYVMDMRVKHAPSINATKNARMMLTARYMKPR